MMFRLIVIVVLFCNLYTSLNGQGISKYVNPFIGTAPTKQKSNWEGHGRTYPGAVAPFGYIQLTPETRVGSSRGYDFRDSKIHFFSCLQHYSGYPNGSSGNCYVQATENSESYQFQKSSRPFSHKNEISKPGYYKLEYDDNGTIVETTATTRTGMFRFTYKNEVKPKILIGDIGQIDVLSDSILTGSRRNMVFEFSQPWTKIEQTSEGVELVFNTPDSKNLLLKLTSSSVNTDKAIKNLQTELPGWDFEKVKRNSQNEWEKHLSVILISDDSESNKIKFYTALYHSMLMPWIISDVDGAYRGPDGKVYADKHKIRYDGFSPWDSFRSLHPLLCILAPERQSDMISSLLEIYKQSGQLPILPMTGFHSVPIIVDSYYKNIDIVDKDLAYEAMKKCLLVEPYFHKDLGVYDSTGFIPSTYPESVTRTVEYAYNDWALAQFALKVQNDKKTYSKLITRSKNYKNLFNPEHLFLEPRSHKGFDEHVSKAGYKEGDKWNYSLFVPHNMLDIINLMGGKNEFSQHLNQAIENEYILFDNEPNFHIPYLLNYAGIPSKTQEWVFQLRNKLFTSTPDGLPGNDDLGALSSWFVFNALGFYPVCPGVPEYNIGVPLFEKAEIHLSNGNTFTINANEISGNKRYIKKARLNGDHFDKSWFSHTTLVSGGEFNFTMDSIPSDWASTGPISYSLTNEETEFVLEKATCSKSIVEPNEPFFVKFQLTNKGATGVKRLRIMIDNKEYTIKNIWVEKGKTVIDSIALVQYKPGLKKLQIENQKLIIDVQAPKDKACKLQYSQLNFPPLVSEPGSLEVDFKIKNISGVNCNSNMELYLNEKLYKSKPVELYPGEEKLLSFQISDFEIGINNIQIGYLEGTFKAYNSVKGTALVDFHRNQKNLVDKSGFKNHVKIHSANSDNPNTQVGSFYVELKNNNGLAAISTELTVMASIKPSKSKQERMSVVTQGDHNVIQIINDNSIEFFAGGWGRGICTVQLANDFFDHWHHIACVAERTELKVFIDGELKGQTKIDGESKLSTDENWCLGGNVEFPGERIFYGEMNTIKIFPKALSKTEINELMK